LLTKLTTVISRKCNGEYIDPYFSGEAMKIPVGPPVTENAERHNNDKDGFHNL
jgi:hypothetical protein